jgi:hypothetical protein
VNVGTGEAESGNGGLEIAGASNGQDNIISDSQVPDKEHPLVTAIQLAEDNSQVNDRETRELHKRLLASVHRISRQNSQVAEKLVLEKLENELGVRVETDMKFEFGKHRYVFDGVAKSGNQLMAIEVKYVRDMKFGVDDLFLRSLDKFTELYNSLSDAQRKEFSFILAIVTDNLDERRLELIKNHILAKNIPLVVKVYDYDNLIKELLPNTSS